MLGIATAVVYMAESMFCAFDDVSFYFFYAGTFECHVEGAAGLDGQGLQSTRY